jgi:hypothetical protein
MPDVALFASLALALNIFHPNTFNLLHMNSNPLSPIQRNTKMAPIMINVLLTTFPGLGLPSTLSLPVPSSSTIGDVEKRISDRLPPSASNLNITTTSNKLLSSRRSEPLLSLLDSPEDSFLPLRLSAALCGGKGGFGAQLRAAGGRMSSRKKRNENTSSNRDINGRRLRTNAEAKALAEYLALKPGMDAKEKEERRKRYQDIIASTEAKADEIENRRPGRLDGKWVEAKEEAAEKTREAVIAAMKAGDIKDLLRESDESESGSEESEGSESDEAAPVKASGSTKATAKPVSFFGWDEDEDMSDSEEDEEDEEAKEEAPPPVPAKGKGKAKA